MTIRDKVKEYAKYTINAHSSEYEDIAVLNRIFKTDITLKELRM